MRQDYSDFEKENTSVFYRSISRFYYTTNQNTINCAFSENYCFIESLETLLLLVYRLLLLQILTLKKTQFSNEFILFTFT